MLRPCCDAMSGFSYAPLMFGEPESFRLDETSPLYAVAVDGSQYRYAVVHTTGNLLNSCSHYVYPHVIPILFPGVVTVLPTGQSITTCIRHSPFGRLRVIATSATD
jgi:hypothetical protein